MSLRRLLPKDSFKKVVPISPVDLNHSLTKNTALHRLVLQQPIQGSMQLDQWYRVNVDIVTEMGILLATQKLEKEFEHGIRLTCAIYHHEPMKQQHQQIRLEMEPLLKDIWDTDTVVIAPWPGFAPKSCHGGFKYRLPSASLPEVSKPFYLIIQSTSHPDSILPIVVGPVQLDPSTASVEHGWGRTTIDSSHQVYRKMPVSNGYHLLIKEQWHGGTSGKLWDSALLMTSLFANAVDQQPDRFSNARILDLSAGTGYIGIYIAKLHQDHPHPPTVLVTDIQEALPLLSENQTINQTNVEIHPLLWGRKKDARRITHSKFKPFSTSRPLDVVIASDVLYNAKDIVSLVQTFLDLSTGKTIIYFGYKNRGLKQEELIQFFQLCDAHFYIDLINPATLHSQPIHFDPITLPTKPIPHHLHVPLLIQSGACIYTMTRK